MYKITFFVTVEHKDQVKGAMFEAGGGRIGHYDCCSFEVEGTGQFRPNEGARPFLGDVGKVETVREARVEMVCEESLIVDVIAAMKEAHPYETPAYDVIKMADF